MARKPLPSMLARWLRSAAKTGDLAQLRDLLAAGADPNTALHRAAFEGQTACLEALLAAGASVDGTGGNNRTPLQYVSTHGPEACVRALIAAGADVNRACRFTPKPFTAALQHGRPSVLKILLRAGADVNTRSADRRGYNTKSWALVDAIRKLGGWPNYVRRRRATLGIWVIRRLPTVIEIDIAACIEPPGGF